jgi:GDP-L-fucose synthase
MEKDESIFIAGHRGLVGSAILRRLTADGFTRLLTRTRAELDLTSRSAVEEFFNRERPTIVVVTAAKVGGIKANNDQPVEFLLENLQIQNNVIRAAHEHGARKLLFLGSSCIYPKFAPQPIPETALLGGPLEPTRNRRTVDKSTTACCWPN